MKDFCIVGSRLLSGCNAQISFKMMLEGDPAFTKEILRGYYLERKVIDEFEEAEKITTFSANDYRKQVNLLESYAINQTDFTSLTNFCGKFELKNSEKHQILVFFFLPKFLAETMKLFFGKNEYVTISRNYRGGIF